MGFRAREWAWSEYQAAVLDKSVSDTECAKLRRSFICADEVYRDYLASERDDARAERDEQ